MKVMYYINGFLISIELIYILIPFFSIPLVNLVMIKLNKYSGSQNKEMQEL